MKNASELCGEYTKGLPSHGAEPFQRRVGATRPFEQIHADLCSVNSRHYLVMVDQFSGWPQVVAFPDENTTARLLINAFRQFFTNVGASVRIWTDNGRQFVAADFRSFLKDWGVTQGTSSPHYAQSNGRAEAEVKTMKKLIKGASTSGSFDPEKFAKALLMFRNTPRPGGASPARIVFGRPLRDTLPAHQRAFAPEWQQEANKLEKRARRAKDMQVQRYNKTKKDAPSISSWKPPQ